MPEPRSRTVPWYSAHSNPRTTVFVSTGLSLALDWLPFFVCCFSSIRMYLNTPSASTTTSSTFSSAIADQGTSATQLNCKVRLDHYTHTCNNMMRVYLDYADSANSWSRPQTNLLVLRTRLTYMRSEWGEQQKGIASRLVLVCL